jgi:hypothetical protein
MRRKMFRMMVIGVLLLSMISSMSSAAVIIRTWYETSSRTVYTDTIPSNETSYGVPAGDSFNDSFLEYLWIVDEKNGSSLVPINTHSFHLDPVSWHRTVVHGFYISYTETLNELELWVEYDDGTIERLSVVDSWRVITEQTHSPYWNVIDW